VNSVSSTDLALLGGTPLRSRKFSKWPQHSAADRERVAAVVESGHWGGYPVPSRWAGEFAQRFADLHNAKYGLCVANGTIALVAALQAAGIKFGDEVIVPAYTWDGTATAVLFAGGVPIFADVDPDTYCLSVESTRAAITPRTRAILPVHLAMRFADMDGLMQLARKHNLKVIDNAIAQCKDALGKDPNSRFLMESLNDALDSKVQLLRTAATLPSFASCATASPPSG